MSNHPVVVEQFRELPGILEIIGLGSVRQPRGQAQEVEIAVLVALDVDGPDGDVEPATRVLWIGCGQLDLLVPGSRWQRGRCVGFAGSVWMSARFASVRNEPIGQGAVPAPREQRPFPSAAIAAAPGFLLKRLHDDNARDKGIAWRAGAELVLLPKIELLRGLFGVSSGFLLELFDGIRNPAISGERGVVDRKRSVLRCDNTVTLMTSRDLTRAEAIVAAMVIADAAVRRLHDSAFQQLSVKPDWRDGLPVHLDVAWPWREPVTIGLHGRWIEREGGSRRFVAMRLSALDFPVPFARIEVHHQGAEAGDADGLPPPDGRVKLANANVIELTTGSAASTSRRPVEVPTSALDIAGASVVEIVRIPRGGIARHDRAVIGEAPRDEGAFGTGGRQLGADPSVGAAGTRRTRGGSDEVVGRSQGEALEATWKALNAACRKRGWELDALPQSRRGWRDDVHGGLDFSKEPLVARVAAVGPPVIVVDRGSPTGNECSLGILVPLDAGMSDRHLAASARAVCTSVDGRWRSRGIVRQPPSDFRVLAVNRDAKVWKDLNTYAEMLARRLASALGL